MNDREYHSWLLSGAKLRWWETDGGCGPRPDYALFALAGWVIVFAIYAVVLIGMILGA